MSDKRVVIDLPEEVWRKAKAQAASQGIFLREFVEEALREKLMEKVEK